MEVRKLNDIDHDNFGFRYITYIALFVDDLDAVNVDLKRNASLVRAGRLDNSLCCAHRISTHGIATCLLHVLFANQLTLKNFFIETENIT